MAIITNFLGKLAVKVFPNRYEQYLNERAARTAAMQALLDATNELRRKGIDVSCINGRMNDAFDAYLSGDFSRAVSWAEMEARKPSWAATC